MFELVFVNFGFLLIISDIPIRFQSSFSSILSFAIICRHGLCYHFHSDESSSEYFLVPSRLPSHSSIHRHISAGETIRSRRPQETPTENVSKSTSKRSETAIMPFLAVYWCSNYCNCFRPESFGVVTGCVFLITWFIFLPIHYSPLLTNVETFPHNEVITCI